MANPETSRPISALESYGGLRDPLAPALGLSDEHYRAIGDLAERGVQKMKDLSKAAGTHIKNVVSRQNNIR